MCQLSETHAWAAQAVGFGNSATGGCVAARLILSSKLGVEVWDWDLTQNRGLGKDTFRPWSIKDQLLSECWYIESADRTKPEQVDQQCEMPLNR